MKEMTIKAIETEFLGYRFRSRLEARWAFFFHSLDIGFTYEEEGFDIDGVWYLPDFHLTAQDRYVEVKHGDGSCTCDECKRDGDEHKAKLMSMAGKRVAVCFGDPACERVVIFDHGKRVPAFLPHLLRSPERESDIILAKTKLIQVLTSVSYGLDLQGTPSAINAMNVALETPDELKTIGNAAIKARQARFEHGETPKDS